MLLVRENRAVWFAREQGKFVEMTDQSGIFRSRWLPGLWLDVNSVFRNDNARLLDVLRQGMATPEHGEFVQRLEARIKG